MALTCKDVKVPVDDGFGVDLIEHFELHCKPASRVGIIPVLSEPRAELQLLWLDAHGHRRLFFPNISSKALGIAR